MPRYHLRFLKGPNYTLRLAQERYEGKVTVVDSTFVCYPVIYMLKAAREMLEKGYTCAQIKEKIEKEGELFAILIPENLNALKNGGRISPAAAALAERKGVPV